MSVESEKAYGMSCGTMRRNLEWQRYVTVRPKYEGVAVFAELMDGFKMLVGRADPFLICIGDGQVDRQDQTGL